jgi:hypothetical protein
MSFANCQMGGINMASPDVCLTPMGTSVPPIPYPNIAQGAMANPGTAVQKVLISGAPAHTLQTIIPSSSGDEAGVCGGVMSGSIMGPSRHLMGASNVLIGGHPATKMTDQTGQNGTSQNVSGSTMAPAQTKVMINSGGPSGGRRASSQEAETSQEKKKPVKLTVTNPRWEHVDQNAAEMRSESTILGDKVILKADVTNVTDGTSILFKVFDTAVSPPQQIAMIVGHVTGGVGSAEWQVKQLTKLEFEAKVRWSISERAEIPVARLFVFSF